MLINIFNNSIGTLTLNCYHNGDLDLLECRETANLNGNNKQKLFHLKIQSIVYIYISDTLKIQCDSHDGHFDCNKIGSSEFSVQCLEIINEGRYECFDFKHT